MSDADILRNLDSAFGFWSATGNQALVDAAAAVGPDFICIDTQHGVALSDLDASLFTVVSHYGVASLVRVASIEASMIGRSLDLGATGIVVPMVESEADAARAVSASRLAPRGSRSFGVQTARIAPNPETDPVCWIQVETRAVMDNLAAVASLDGVDGLYIGPADLGLALVGVPASDVESVFDGTHPKAAEMAAAFDSVVETCRKAGISAGLHCGSGKAAAIAAERGFTVAAVAADLPLIGAGLAEHLSAARP